MTSDLGGLHYAVNDAGIPGMLATVENIPDSLLMGPYDPIRNNVYGTLHCMMEEVSTRHRHVAVLQVKSPSGSLLEEPQHGGRDREPGQLQRHPRDPDGKHVRCFQARSCIGHYCDLKGPMHL